MNRNHENDSIHLTMDAFDPSDETSLIDLWKIFQRHLRSIIGLIFVAGLIGSQYAFSITPLYIAEVKLLVETVAPKFISVDPFKNNGETSLFYQTQSEIITSRSIAKSVAEVLELHKYRLFASVANENSVDRNDGPRSFVGKWVLWLRGLFDTSKTNDINDSDYKLNHGDSSDDVSLSAAINYILANIDVEIVKSSQVIKIKFESPDRHLSSQIANAIADAYIEKGLSTQLEIKKKATLWLSDQLSELREKLEDSENALRSYQEKEKMVDVSSLKSIASGKLGGITSALIKAKAHLAEAEIQYKQVKESKIEGKSFDSLQAVLNNGLVQRLKEQQVKLNRNVMDLSGRYGEKHPKMIAAKSDLQEAQSRLDLEVNKVVESIIRQYEAALSNENELEQLSRELQVEVMNHQAKEFKLAKLENDVDKNRQLYDIFLARFKEASHAGNSNLTNITIVDSAIPPETPAKPNKKVIIISFLVFGFTLGVGLSFLREFLKNTFVSPEDVEKTLGIPLLGIIPILDNEKSDFIPERHSYQDPESPFIEPLNNILVSVTYANIDKPAKVIMITSSTANEGKTTLSSNLSLTYSRVGKTLLIDGDFRKQQHTKKVLERRKAKGMAELAAGKINFSEAVFQDSEINNLYYMGRGRGLAKPIELLSSKRFSTLIESLRNKFDYIIVDSAPLLPVSDSLVLGNLVDEVILVIKADSTTHSMAKESLKRLNSAQITPLGVVLQQVDIEKLKQYDANYYHYGYGYE